MLLIAEFAINCLLTVFLCDFSPRILRPDWGRVGLLDDSVFLPFSGPSGKIYYYNELSALECLLERSLQDVREGLFIDPRELLAQRKAVRRR